MPKRSYDTNIGLALWVHHTGTTPGICLCFWNLRHRHLKQVQCFGRLAGGAATASAEEEEEEAEAPDEASLEGGAILTQNQSHV